MKSLLTALVAVVALSGCSVHIESRQPPQPTTADRYLSVVRGAVPAFEQVPDKTLLQNAHGVCDTFAAGATGIQTMQMFLDSGFTPEQAGTLVGGAIRFFCPQYKTRLTNPTSL